MRIGFFERMKIGLIDVDGHNFPNLPLMKLSAWHKQRGDTVDMSEIIGKSSKAIRGRVYSMYLTENLDKARELIGTGSFGDNRPERKLKQWNVMDTDERIEQTGQLRFA